MRTIYNVPAAEDDDCDEDSYADLDDSNNAFSQIVCHETGHAVISEILCPESVTLVSVHNRGESGGFVDYYNDHRIAPLDWKKSRIVSTLGGAAAIEQKFGVFDVGCRRDLDQAFANTRDLVVNCCVCGLHLHQNRYNDSESLLAEQEWAVSAEVEKYYRKAKEIISLNKEFFDKLAEALAKKKLLSAIDVQKIKSECKIVPVSL